MFMKTSATLKAVHVADTHDVIRVQGARENNLKDVSIDIPKRRLTVFTGVSGSGKSSLVFNTIAAESQRLMTSLRFAVLSRCGSKERTMRIVTLRANGPTGRLVVQAALARGWDVTAAVSGHFSEAGWIGRRCARLG